jgi:hypothetical protein
MFLSQLRTAFTGREGRVIANPFGELEVLSANYSIGSNRILLGICLVHDASGNVISSSQHCPSFDSSVPGLLRPSEWPLLIGRIRQRIVYFQYRLTD